MVMSSLDILRNDCSPDLCSRNSRDAPFQCAYKSNTSILDVVISIVHHVYKAPDASMKPAISAFSEYLSAFDSVPRSLLLCLIETSDLAFIGLTV